MLTNQSVSPPKKYNYWGDKFNILFYTGISIDCGKASFHWDFVLNTLTLLAKYKYTEAEDLLNVLVDKPCHWGSTPSALPSLFSKVSDSCTSLSWDTNLENWGAKYPRNWRLGKYSVLQYWGGNIYQLPFFLQKTQPEERPKFSQYLVYIDWKSLLTEI